MLGLNFIGLKSISARFRVTVRPADGLVPGSGLSDNFARDAAKRAQWVGCVPEKEPTGRLGPGRCGDPAAR